MLEVAGRRTGETSLWIPRGKNPGRGTTTGAAAPAVRMGDGAGEAETANSRASAKTRPFAGEEEEAVDRRRPPTTRAAGFLLVTSVLEEAAAVLTSTDGTRAGRIEAGTGIEARIRDGEPVSGTTPRLLPPRRAIAGPT